MRAWNRGTVILVVMLAGVGVARAQPASIQALLSARTEGGDAVALPLVDERIEVAVDGQLATTTIRQTFLNRTSAVLEGSYTVRSGQGARVDGFSYWNGEQRVVGEVFERTTAQAVYNSVRTVNRDPGLLEQIGEGSFVFRVFPIQPGEQKRIEVRLTQWLARRGPRLELRAPIGRGDAAFRMEIRDGRGLRDVSSGTHAIEVEQVSATRVLVRAVRRPESDSPEIVIGWRPTDAPWTIDAALHRDRGHEAFFVLALGAPELARDAAAPKDVTLVIDRSGSMAGEPLRQAQRAAADVVRRLDDRDRLNVIAFDDAVDPLFRAPRPATAYTRADALDFIERMRDGGGTDIALALRRALDAQDDEPGRARVVLFVTDGQSDNALALRAAEDDDRDVRVFTVGVGDGVDRALLARLAAMKRGRFTYIESAGALPQRMAALYSQIETPLLVDVSLEVDGASALRVYPRTLPDLFASDEIRISGRLRGEGRVRFTLRGVRGGEPVELVKEVDLPAAVSRPWVGELWAQSRVEDLLEEIALRGEELELTDEVVELALAYDLVTPYTAFLAIPESELTAAAAEELAVARSRRAEVLARNPDAAALLASGGGGEEGEDDTEYRATAGLPAFAGDGAGGEMREQSIAEPEGSDGALAGRAGCASCAAAAGRDDGATSSWLFAAAAALILCRRRAPS